MSLEHPAGGSFFIPIKRFFFIFVNPASILITLGQIKLGNSITSLGFGFQHLNYLHQQVLRRCNFYPLASERI